MLLWNSKFRCLVQKRQPSLSPCVLSVICWYYAVRRPRPPLPQRNTTGVSPLSVAYLVLAATINIWRSSPLTGSAAFEDNYWFVMYASGEGINIERSALAYLCTNISQIRCLQICTPNWTSRSFDPCSDILFNIQIYNSGANRSA